MEDYKAISFKELAASEIPESVTLDELTAAFKRHGYEDFTSPGHAERLFADIARHREPEWETGDVVKAADNKIWMRDGNSWRRPGYSGFWGTDVPKRPLKRMVETS